MEFRQGTQRPNQIVRPSEVFENLKGTGMRMKDGIKRTETAPVIKQWHSRQRSRLPPKQDLACLTR